MADFALAPEESQIVLISNDGEEFQVNTKVSSLSKLIKSMLDEADMNEEQQIRLPNVNKQTLAKALEYATHYLEEPMNELTKPLADSDINKLVQPFYANFILTADKDALYSLTLAANYLDIKPLLDLCCARIASFIKNKTPEEIRVNLDIAVDFTPEEEAAIRAENKWVNEL